MSETVLVVVVGSTNKAKVAAVEEGLKLIFPTKKTTVVPKEVTSGVRSQPMSDEEGMTGAINRAKGAFKMMREGTAQFGIGIEGGVSSVCGHWFESGWVAVVDKNGKLGLGTAARLELSDTIVKQLKSGKELAQVVDAMSGETDVRSSQGVMGILTNGLLPRKESLINGIIFAFAPFISEAKYW